MKCLLQNSFFYKQKLNSRLFIHQILSFPVLSNLKMYRAKYLNVAEKNDAAKNIAQYLSKGTSRRREGLSKYNKIYEFEAEVMQQKCLMVMTSVSGHLLGYEFAPQYGDWRSCDPLTLFDAEVLKYCPKDYLNIKNTLEREARTCNGLIIWTDCDREGENIGFEIIEVCKKINNNLQIYRAKFSEITSVSVFRALRNLEQPNKNISDAVDVRQELDLRIGAAFTRFQTLRLQRVFPSKLGVTKKLVSYGSCQFPTLGFVVERYKAINNFIEEPFWKIKVNHTVNNLSVEFAWERVRLFDQDICQVFHNLCMENPLAKVTNVKIKPKSKWRPLPLDTVELEKLASRKLKINAKETMRIAEKLYTQGFISYPRTETNEYPKEINLAQLVGLQTGDPNWGGFAQQLVEAGPTPRQGNKSDKAHPPIHPTKYANNLTGNEQRVYEFIVRSFLACCSKDAQGQETTATIEIAGETFSASGLMIIARNYLEVYPYDKWSDKEIHKYESGDTFNPTSIDMVEGSTSPPQLLTEADLIALMEKHGIGTDATHAEHIETIKSREYVMLNDGVHFVPGVLGMGLVEGYDDMDLKISKPDLRAQLEADLKDICEGRKRPEDVLRDQIAIYKNKYITLKAEADKLDRALAITLNEAPVEAPTEQTYQTITPAAKCPACGSIMTVRRKKNSPSELYIGCAAYPQCKHAIWLPSLVKSLEVLSESCPTCGPDYKQMKFEWKDNSINHMLPPPYISCVFGCDTTLNDVLGIRSRPRNPPNPPNIPNVSNQIPNITNNVTMQSSNNPRINRINPPHSNVLNGVRMHMNNIINQNNAQIPNASNVRMQNVNQNPRPFLPPIRREVNSVLPTPSPTDSEDNSVVCDCHRPAKLLTVQKRNNNFGKKFYKCEENVCNFFLWAPDPNATENNLDTPSTSNFSAASDEVTCNCGLPCVQKTVRKEGPNKGRMFYCCTNMRPCNFFQWADGETTSRTASNFSQSSSNTRGRGRGAGRGTARGAGTSRSRRCGICQQEGHNRTNCPNNN